METSGVSPDALKVVPTANAQFGDYQWNGALPLANTLKQNPRALAQQLVEKVDVDGISEAPEIAGPGFINFRLKPQFIASMAAQALRDEHLGVAPSSTPRTFVVDYSGPNVAKPMHVGHIRSTIIGDAVARLLRFSGHNVITDNHVGDWGTQFGKLIVGWKKHLDEAALQSDPISEMERLYKLVNARSESDPAVADEARAETAKLQNGDAENLAIWEKLRELSQQQFDEIYSRLGIEFDHTLGESFYNPRLGDIVRELKDKGVARDSEGAVAVFTDGTLPPKDDPFLIQRSGEWKDNPALVQKSDGSALYATTDLATLEYRAQQWHPDEIVYVTDGRQQQHFQQVFNAFRRWHPEYSSIVLSHAWFGTVLGEDGKPFKTRTGEAVRLKDLLDEAEARALGIVREKTPDLSEERQREVARVLGIGSVKYFDLAQSRTSDYVFSWDKMLSMQGNTAVYLQYAYVRIRSIFRRAQEQGIDTNQVLDELTLKEPAELELAKFILRFPLAIETALSDYRINALSDYLFDLAQKFTSFYDACPVLKSDEPLRSSRLALCDLTSQVLKQGLSLLGIETIEQM